jgi:hypothetical protein
MRLTSSIFGLIPSALFWRDPGHCVCNIDPPAPPYAIIRRACSYRGENRGPGMDDRGRD